LQEKQKNKESEILVVIVIFLYNYIITKIYNGFLAEKYLVQETELIISGKHNREK